MDPHLKSHRLLLAGLAGLLVVVGCASPSSSPPSTPGADAGGPASKTTGPRGSLRIAWPTEPENLNSKIGVGGGMHQFHWVFDSFLTYTNANGLPQPMLAREIPTQENGDWVVNPDGTMVTTYRLRENARWHDGTPLTAGDFVFGYEVYRDPDLPVRERMPEALMSGVTAPDDHTVVVMWKEPYVTANRLTHPQLAPIPRHLLEEKYRSNRATFAFAEEWTVAYVGTGPFRLERWTPGFGLVARAHMDWILGPPKLQTIEIRFISDPRTLLANILSGEVDLVNSPGIGAAEASVARDQWAAKGEGYIRTWHRTIRFVAFQFREVPSWQRAVTDLRVRQALLHATDREALLEVTTHGLGLKAGAFIMPSDPLFPDVERALTRYPYDPNRAGALLAEAGWRRPQPGAQAQAANAQGEALNLELWTTGGGSSEQEGAIMVDNWRAVGINASLFMIPAARQRDQELRASFPSVNLTSRFPTLDDFVFTSTHLPTAEARWQGANRGSFWTADIDQLFTLAVSSLREGERRQAVIALHKTMSEMLGVGPLYYDADFLIAKSKLKGPIGETAFAGGVSWNIFEWEISE